MSEPVRQQARAVIAEELAAERDAEGRIHLTETHVRFGAAALGSAAAAGLTALQLGAVGYAVAQQGPGAGSYGTEAHPLEEIYASTVDRQTDEIRTDTLSIAGNEFVLDADATVANEASNVRVRSDAIEIADGAAWNPAMAEWYDGSAWGGVVVERYTGNAWSQIYPETAIPDSESLHSRYDATQLSLSDQDSVTTWPDETDNGHDLTAGTAPTYVSDGINGNPSVRFDGVDDVLQAQFSAVPQPNTIYVVWQLTETTGTNPAILDSTNTNDRNLTGFNNGELGIYAGSYIRSSQGEDTNPHITGGLFDGASSTLRIDGSQEASGDTSAVQSHDGHTVGRYAPSDGDYTPIDVGEILFYPEDKSGSQDDIEQYLADKWGFAL